MFALLTEANNCTSINYFILLSEVFSSQSGGSNVPLWNASIGQRSGAIGGPRRRVIDLCNPSQLKPHQPLAITSKGLPFYTSHGRVIGNYDFTWRYEAIFRVPNRPDDIRPSFLWRTTDEFLVGLDLQEEAWYKFIEWNDGFKYVSTSRTCIDEAIRTVVSTYKADSAKWAIEYVTDLSGLFAVTIPSFQLSMLEEVVKPMTEEKVIEYLV